MPKFIYPLFTIGLSTLFITFVSAQGKKTVDPSKNDKTLSEELLWGWEYIEGKVVTMAEDFPEDKYDFKAQKDERTFAENLIHIAAGEYIVMSTIKGKLMGPAEQNQDSLRKKYATKADIVKFVRQAAADGAKLIKERGDAGLTKKFKYPWGNFMVHGSLLWWSMLEHTGEHYGQLVVYYRLNGLIPPESRRKK